MAIKKNVVKFNIGDAPKPKHTSDGRLALRAPLDVTLGAYPSPVNLKLGLSASVPVCLYSTKIDLNKSVFGPGEEITISGIVKSAEMSSVEYGETIAYAIPFFTGEFEVE